MQNDDDDMPLKERTDVSDQPLDDEVVDIDCDMRIESLPSESDKEDAHNSHKWQDPRHCAMRAPVICRPVGNTGKSVVFIPIPRKKFDSNLTADLPKFSWMKCVGGSYLVNENNAAIRRAQKADRDVAMQHRLSERKRHKETNTLIDRCLKLIPVNSDLKESRVLLLQRIVAYFCFMEKQIEDLCTQLGLDPDDYQMSEISNNVHNTGSLYAQLNKTMDMDDYAPVEILNAYLDMMGQQLVTVGSASARGGDSRPTDTPGALADDGPACSSHSTETPGVLIDEVDEEQEVMGCDEIEQQIAIISDLSADSEERNGRKRVNDDVTVTPKYVSSRKDAFPKKIIKRQTVVGHSLSQGSTSEQDQETSAHCTSPNCCCSKKFGPFSQQELDLMSNEELESLLLAATAMTGEDYLPAAYQRPAANQTRAKVTSASQRTPKRDDDFHTVPQIM